MEDRAAAELAAFGGWTNDDWKGLLLNIRHGRCTPFLGAGVCHGILPLGKDIAELWAKEHKYPFPDRNNLVRVAQFVDVALETDSASKLMLIDMFQGCGQPDFDDIYEPHRVVADLGLPVYITTNYDNFMVEAIQRGTPPRRPKRAYSKWYLEPYASAPPEDSDLRATKDEPVVFHLHGILEHVESMVLTEDDYLDFLMNTSLEREIIPPRIERAFTQSSLLFMGYSLEDMNFKVIFRRLANYMMRSASPRHVSVQLAPAPGEPIAEQIERANDQRAFLERRFNVQGIKMYWGTCAQFARELRERWGG